MEECGGEGGGDGNGPVGGGGEILEEVDLGVNSGILFKEVAAKAGRIGGGIGAIVGRCKEYDFDE